MPTSDRKPVKCVWCSKSFILSYLLVNTFFAFLAFNRSLFDDRSRWKLKCQLETESKWHLSGKWKCHQHHINKMHSEIILVFFKTIVMILFGWIIKTTMFPEVKLYLLFFLCWKFPSNRFEVCWRKTFGANPTSFPLTPSAPPTPSVLSFHFKSFYSSSRSTSFVWRCVCVCAQDHFSWSVVLFQSTKLSDRHFRTRFYLLDLTRKNHFTLIDRLEKRPFIFSILVGFQKYFYLDFIFIPTINK